ncbi:VOC family protein [Ornithinimicrobium cryptoxanthini]|uniref:Glyoxalase-like domain-containing protein n=1 Tax=Ornithinimicrobium cryptoxanthini TaxID=2934161 RepID=A0ABY4YID6_9MICO|nr:VOC family protein [Ornithinimicrobium cryptoxanthini]USQ76524.1 hypothetical protein NF557_00895 [Ornithinimicrobium cryptoxanthini]
MARPRIEVTSVSISTSAPRELADFYARLLGVEVADSEGPRAGEPPTAGWAQLRRVEGRLRMTLNFEWDEHYVPPVWPTPVPSQLGWPSVATGPGSVPVTSVPVRSVPVREAIVVSAGPDAQQVMSHLDLWVDDLEVSAAWAIECGATEHPHQPQETVQVMIDPHGHPFCLFTS